jgi:hypothetical protein
MADRPFAFIRPDPDPERGFPTALVRQKGRVSAALRSEPIECGGGGNRTRVRSPPDRGELGLDRRFNPSPLARHLSVHPGAAANVVQVPRDPRSFRKSVVRS